MSKFLILFLVVKYSAQMKFTQGKGIELTCPPVSAYNRMTQGMTFFVAASKQGLNVTRY